MKRLETVGGLRMKRLTTAKGVPWFVNPRVWWRHPALRIAVTILIMALDFYIYGEDPVQDSRVEYSFPVLGHIYGLLALWPAEAGLILLRLVIILAFLALGVYVGRQWLHHRLLRDRLGLTMFEENKGTLAAMVVTLPFTLAAGAIVYNLLVTGTVTGPISSRTYRPYNEWGKFWQYISVFLDVSTIAQVLDVTLQDREVYPNWARGPKRIWNDKWGGWVRIVAVWVAFPALLACLYAAIASTGHDPHEIRWNNPVIGLTELSRTVVVSAIIICDVLQVAQDWEFPTFDRPLDIMIVGTFYTDLSCNLLERALGWLARPFSFIRPSLLSFFRLSVTGGWLMYGPLLGSLAADLSCGNTQFRYKPEKYGQYVDNSSHIWGIRDTALLDLAYDTGTLVRPELITLAARRDPLNQFYNATSSATDIALSSRHSEHSNLAILALLPGIMAMVSLGVLLWGGERYWKSAAMRRIGKASGCLKLPCQRARQSSHAPGEGPASSHDPEAGPVQTPVDPPAEAGPVQTPVDPPAEAGRVQRPVDPPADVLAL